MLFILLLQTSLEVVKCLDYDLFFTKKLEMGVSYVHLKFALAYGFNCHVASLQTISL